MICEINDDDIRLIKRSLNNPCFVQLNSTSTYHMTHQLQQLYKYIHLYYVCLQICVLFFVLLE